jgi:hypothetical protein
MYVDDFLQIFEGTCREMRYSSDSDLGFLIKPVLSGNARLAVAQMPINDIQSYAKITELLRREFGNKLQPIVLRQELNSMQYKGGDLQAYFTRMQLKIRELGRDWGEPERERRLAETFLESFDRDMKIKILTLQPDLNDPNAVFKAAQIAQFMGKVADNSSQNQRGPRQNDRQRGRGGTNQGRFPPCKHCGKNNHSQDRCLFNPENKNQQNNSGTPKPQQNQAAQDARPPNTHNNRGGLSGNNRGGFNNNRGGYNNNRGGQNNRGGFGRGQTSFTPTVVAHAEHRVTFHEIVRNKADIFHHNQIRSTRPKINNNRANFLLTPKHNKCKVLDSHLNHHHRFKIRLTLAQYVCRHHTSAQLKPCRHRQAKLTHRISVFHVNTVVPIAVQWDIFRRCVKNRELQSMTGSHWQYAVWEDLPMSST